jgi:hypothetical protein
MVSASTKRDKSKVSARPLEVVEIESDSLVKENRWVIQAGGDGVAVSRIPFEVVVATFVVIVNATLMAVADVILEFLFVADALPFKLDIRVEFLVLTIISALLAVHALLGLMRRELDATANSIRVSLVVELGLVLSDIVYLHRNAGEWSDLLPLRLPFIIVTVINVILVVFIPIRLGITSRVFLFGASQSTTLKVRAPISLIK